MKISIYVGALSLLAASAAFAADQSFEIDGDIAVDNSKIAIVVLPSAYEASLQNAEHVGESTRVAVDLLAGTTSGARLEGILWHAANKSVAIEAQGGYGFTRFGWAPEAGAGIRMEINVAEDFNHKNALFISPSVDVYVITAPSAGGGFLGLVPYTNVYFVGTNADIRYVHQFSRHFGWDVGVRLGADVGLAGKAANGNQALGMISPELALFTGIRF